MCVRACVRACVRMRMLTCASSIFIGSRSRMRALTCTSIHRFSSSLRVSFLRAAPVVGRGAEGSATRLSLPPLAFRECLGDCELCMSEDLHV